MRLVCPSCGAMHSIEAFINDEQARKFLSVIVSLNSSLQKNVLNYLTYFRPESGKGLRWSKAVRLLEELKSLIEAEYVEWDRKKPIKNDTCYWINALDKMIDSPPKRLPLKNHNYLRVIVYEIAEEEDKRLEEERERMRRSGWNRIEEEEKNMPTSEQVKKLINSALKRRRL
ncbi:hypothetical protein FHQ18_11585 [Deferribacter autotrophicus]|uniref:DUF2752 domain-containing protein n=1 Tax=Deferribacter autotrophicus TaxID=500465 RepID=A0A5A8F1Q8_9BACT|nr:hypothetical protein [Deferribacter autotrophicus]KAA0257199.1 hypothetical protein FHQ18_11585 [Deferribacter autotrophicus]